MAELSDRAMNARYLTAVIDSMALGAVVDECAAGAAELVVERDAGGEAEEALKDAHVDRRQALLLPITGGSYARDRPRRRSNQARSR